MLVFLTGLGVSDRRGGCGNMAMLARTTHKLWVLVLHMVAYRYDGEAHVVFPGHARVVH